MIVPTANGKDEEATLFSTIGTQALKHAAAEHPGIKLATEGGVLAMCRKEHGLVPSWPELQRLYPDHLPDDAALKAAEDAERDEMRRIRQGWLSVTYMYVLAIIRARARNRGAFSAHII